MKDTVGTIGGSARRGPPARSTQLRVVQAQLISTTAPRAHRRRRRSAAAAFLAGTVQQPDGPRSAMVDHLDRQLVDGRLRPPSSMPRLQRDRRTPPRPSPGSRPTAAALLLGEALDVASHRFDAWVTSLATRRLSDLRAATPTGVTLGAYGVVEDLARRPARPAVPQPPPGAPTPLVADVRAAAATCTRLRWPRPRPRPCCGPATSPTPPATRTPARWRSTCRAAASASRSACSTASARASPSVRCSATGPSASCTSAAPTRPSRSCAALAPPPVVDRDRHTGGTAAARRLRRARARADRPRRRPRRRAHGGRPATSVRRGPRRAARRRRRGRRPAAGRERAPDRPRQPATGPPARSTP